jgi:hypothetical protein
MGEIYSMALNINRKGNHRVSVDFFRGLEGCRRRILFRFRGFHFHLWGNLLGTYLFGLLFNLFLGWSCRFRGNGGKGEKTGKRPVFHINAPGSHTPAWATLWFTGNYQVLYSFQGAEIAHRRVLKAEPFQLRKKAKNGEVTNRNPRQGVFQRSVGFG